MICTITIRGVPVSEHCWLVVLVVLVVLRWGVQWFRRSSTRKLVSLFLKVGGCVCMQLNAIVLIHVFVFDVGCYV